MTGEYLPPFPVNLVRIIHGEDLEKKINDVIADEYKRNRVVKQIVPLWDSDELTVLIVFAFPVEDFCNED